MSRTQGNPWLVALVHVGRLREHGQAEVGPPCCLLVEPPGGPHAVHGGTSAHGRQGRERRRGATCCGPAWMSASGVRESAGAVGPCAAAGAARCGRPAVAAGGGGAAGGGVLPPPVWRGSPPAGA